MQGRSLASIRQQHSLLNLKLERGINLIWKEVLFFKIHPCSSGLSACLVCTHVPFRTKKLFVTSYTCSTAKRSMVSSIKPCEHRLTLASKTLGSSPQSTGTWKLDVTWKNVKSAFGWKRSPTPFGKFTQKNECESRDALSSTKTRMTSCSGSLQMSNFRRQTSNGWTRT